MKYDGDNCIKNGLEYLVKLGYKAQEIVKKLIIQ